MPRILLSLFLFFCQQTSLQAQTPSTAQLDWHETNFYLFFHFGPNTFTNVEWGHGTETEDVFNPSALDCRQWCRIAKAAGAKGVIITAKHHDGFCLWPSAYSTHTVRESPWENGQGDVLRELADACREYDLKLGFYLSPWDRNHPQYGTPAYNDVYTATLTELLTQYGSLFEIWWDGANGEGPNGKKQVYDFHRFEKIAASLQPGAVIFSDIGPGCRWVGNEQGFAAETNWCRMDTASFGRGATGPPADRLQHGQPDGALWLPAECDVSIRPGWFYHPEEDTQVKTPEQIWDLYLKSVGRGANLILNVPPDRNGRIHPQDSAALVAFGLQLQNAFSSNLASGKKVQPRYQFICLRMQPRRTKNLGDGNASTFGNAPKYRLRFWKKRTVNTLILRENIANGQHIKEFELNAKVGHQWQTLARGTTVGNKRILQFEAVKAKRFQLTIRTLDGMPPGEISEWGLFEIPD